MIVTIDGPAGVGKSTAARQLAERLGFDFLDTGAMYRAVALCCLEQNGAAEDADLTAQIAKSVHIEALSGHVLCDGRDVSGSIRSPLVTHGASIVAQNPAVREALVQQQREIAVGRNIVSEGRDQGTVVFPHAECKFFLTADPQERARRRHREMAEAGQTIEMEELVRQQNERDDRDQQRLIAPLRPANDALIVDTTDQSPEEVLDYLVESVHSRQARTTAQ
jgi:cytidylate kinase